MQYSASVANFFNDTTMEPVYDWHPRMDNVVYYGMDWLCPVRACMHAAPAARCPLLGLGLGRQCCGGAVAVLWWGCGGAVTVLWWCCE